MKLTPSLLVIYIMCPDFRCLVLILVTVLLTLLSVNACGNRTTPPDARIETDAVMASEPDHYSTTVVRVIEDSGRREETVSRIVRSGDMFREEWTERGEKRALIWRPDLGKSFLLSLDKQVYVESDLIPEMTESSNEPQTSNANARMPLDAETIESAFNDGLQPVSVESRLLPEQTIDNRACSVIERRASFADGHTGVTRIFRARDLSGLIIRVEIESNATAPGMRIVTERRDIKTEVAAGEFDVPQGFKKVERL